MKTVRRNDLIEPELCYEIVGALFDVSNELGPDHKENVYQNALGKALNKRGLAYEEQVHVPLTFHGSKVGFYYLDFLVGKKIILEIKSGARFIPRNFKQVEGYLSALGLPLAILAYFGKDGVTFKRVVNKELLKRDS
ncbi:GxxExxY protein [Candidatus Uhrbacteria bacterium]|nr:GxxExxY protein [Candidatus Uhrbacteria bacterium]